MTAFQAGQEPFVMSVVSIYCLFMICISNHKVTDLFVEQNFVLVSVFRLSGVFMTLRHFSLIFSTLDNLEKDSRPGRSIVHL